MEEKAILFDPTRCIGCRACQVACKQWNDLKGETTANRGSYENPRDLSPDTWMTIDWRDGERKGKVEWLYTFRTCFHCTDAQCEQACPVDAISFTQEGFVVIDHEECIGCGNCVDECPFDVPRIGNDEDETAMKCDACTSRTAEGESPACVKSCPVYALTFGDRKDLVKDGKERVKLLKANGYSNACLYGEIEQGGLHVLSVLDDLPSVYGLKDFS